MSEDLEYFTIIEKLIGPIEPVGDSDVDRIRLKNLEQYTNLIDKMLVEVDSIASSYKDHHQSSLSVAGEHCSKFMDSLGIEE